LGGGGGGKVARLSLGGGGGGKRRGPFARKKREFGSGAWGKRGKKNTWTLKVGRIRLKLKTKMALWGGGGEFPILGASQLLPKKKGNQQR